MSEKVVVDSFALVALFHKEPGWQHVQAALYEQEKAHARAFLNWINWGEFFYTIKRRVGAARAEEALRRLEQLPLELVPVDQALVRAAAELTSTYPVSYAGAFCVATAQRVNGTVLTNDQELRAVEQAVTIRWLTP